MEPAKNVEELASGRENLRAVPRFGVDEDAQVLLVEYGTSLCCRIVDLSLGGCRIRTKERFTARAKARVEVSFKVRGLAFRFCGMTQWTDGRNLAGIRFVDVSTRRREDLAEAIGEIAEKAAAKQAAEKLAAEQEAAAKLAAEEHAAAPAANAPDAGKQNESQQQHSTVQMPAIEAQPLHGSRTLFALPWAGGGQRTPTATIPMATIKELSGPLGGSATAERSEAEQRPPRASSGSPQLVAAQRPETPVASQPPSKPIGRERRAQSREGVDTSAIIFLVNVASVLTGRILDLSLGGCRIRTDERFPVGIYTRIETEFRLEGLPFRLGGVIQAIHDQDRRNVGIRFLDMSSRKREQIEQLIEEIEAAKRDQGPGTSHPSEPRPLAGGPGRE
jgi:c-di-GMP-binding flagellar brake protein YcgR